jgi:hypothetical protein
MSPLIVAVNLSRRAAVPIHLRAVTPNRDTPDRCRPVVQEAA